VEFQLKGKGVDEDPKGVLSIDSKTGVIKVHRKVDFEQYRVLIVRGVRFIYFNFFRWYMKAI